MGMGRDGAEAGAAPAAPGGGLGFSPRRPRERSFGRSRSRSGGSKAREIGLRLLGKGADASPPGAPGSGLQAMGLGADYSTRFLAPMREIGCGNFGTVFEALREPDSAAARAGAPSAAAVKVLPRELMTMESGGLRQLGKEVDIWGEVQHSLSVVSFEGVFQEGASDVRLVMARCGTWPCRCSRRWRSATPGKSCTGTSSRPTSCV